MMASRTFARRIVARRFRHLATPVVLGLVALGLAGCSNRSTDAASMTWHDGTGTHTIHIADAKYKKELGELISSKAFQTLLTSNNFKLSGDGKNTTSQNVSSSYLGQLVYQSAVDAEFSRLHLTVSAAARDAAIARARQSFALNSEIQTDPSGNQVFVGKGIVFASFSKSLQNVLIDRQARSDALASYFASPTAAKTHALYDEFASDLCPSGRVVSQILVKDVATAQDILTQLRGGASFATLARTKSTDATSAKAGGAVGCLRKGTFVAPFEAASYAAPFGVPTGPVKSQFGYHVILVSHPAYADLQGEITQALSQNPFVAAELRLQSMKVWINPQYGTGTLGVSQQGQLLFHVTPPSAPAVRTCREDSAACSPPTSAPTTTVPAAG